MQQGNNLLRKQGIEPFPFISRDKFLVQGIVLSDEDAATKDPKELVSFSTIFVHFLSGQM